MSGKMSREKGKRGERECAKCLNETLGIEDVRRGQQYSGEEGRDIIGVPGLHMEVKRQERVNIEKACEQAERDAVNRAEHLGDLTPDIPVVFHRANDKPWRCTVALSDLKMLALRILTVCGFEVKQGGE